MKRKEKREREREGKWERGREGGRERTVWSRWGHPRQAASSIRIVQWAD